MLNKLGGITSRDKIQFAISCILMIFGCVILLLGLLIEPAGQIHSSVLIAFGEIATLAAAILGIDAVYTNKLQHIVTKMKNSEKLLAGLDKSNTENSSQDK